MGDGSLSEAQRSGYEQFVALARHLRGLARPGLPIVRQVLWNGRLEGSWNAIGHRCGDGDKGPLAMVGLSRGSRRSACAGRTVHVS